MSIKKYTNNAWVSIPYKEYGTEADTITTLPKTIITDGTSATATIKGNLSQSGTPTPTSPIYPSEVGNKTANLFDVNATDTNNGYVVNGYLLSDGTINTNNSYRTSEYIPILSNQKYITYAAGLSNPSVCFYDANKNYISGDNYAGRQYAIFTTSSDAKYLRLSFRGIDGAIMFLNLGDTVLPYEPYGYKIPILSGGVTTPVYLGEVQSERQIKKYEFTGNESITNVDSTNHIYAVRGVFNSNPQILQAGGCCSHYKYNNAISSLSINLQDGDYTLNKIVDDYSFTIKDDNISSSTNLRTYLRQQYDNGTPVTVWYVLATPTTGIVNEPIRKIGNYADSVSVTGIPTTGTAEQFDVDTTLKPSEVDLTYHGWHEHQPEKYVGGVVNKFDDICETGYYNDSGVLVTDTMTSHSTTFIPVTTTTYTISGLWYTGGAVPAFAVYEWDNNKQWLRRSNRQYPPSNNKVTFTIGNDTAYITIQVATEHGDIMLNEGSTALPYEPYYKWIED